jgi:transcriptional/translational regulatory protein YebC/TACO1
MKQGEYESVEQMEADLNLMLENAKRYNMPTSGIYKRALRLQQILQVLTSSSYSGGMLTVRVSSCHVNL